MLSLLVMTPSVSLGSDQPANTTSTSYECLLHDVVKQLSLQQQQNLVLTSLYGSCMMATGWLDLPA